MQSSQADRQRSRFTLRAHWLAMGMSFGLGCPAVATPPLPNVVVNLADDIGYGETRNLAAQHPEKVKTLEEVLRQVRARGHRRQVGIRLEESSRRRP